MNPTLRYPVIGDTVFFYADETQPPFPAIITGINAWGATENEDHNLSLFVLNPLAKTSFFLSHVQFSETPTSNKACWQTEDYVGRPEGIVREPEPEPELVSVE